MISDWEIVIRLVLSAVVGGIVGMEREASHRPAGLRTHILVTLGSTLIMLISMYGFQGLGPNNSGGDPARLAAQVVSGIGFLGAGTILRTGNNIRGLTTAASIWVCGGIGLAIGNGYYLGGLTTSVIVMFVLRNLGFLQKKKYESPNKLLIVQSKERMGLISDIGHVLEKNNISIKDIKVINEENTEEFEEDMMEVRFKVMLPSRLEDISFFDEVLNILGVQNAMWEGDLELACKKTNNSGQTIIQ